MAIMCGFFWIQMRRSAATIHEMNAVRRWPVAVRKKNGPDWGIFYETRVTRGDVVLLSVTPRSGI